MAIFLRGFFGEVFELPAGDAEFIGEFFKFGKLGGGEEETTGGVAAFAEVSFDLTGEEAFFVAVAEDVIEDSLHVCGLASVDEGAAGPGVGVDDLEVEAGGGFGSFEAAFGGEVSADESADEFVNQGHAVAFVSTEGEEGGDFVGVGGFVSVFVDGGAGRERFAFALKLLDAAHGDG